MSSKKVFIIGPGFIGWNILDLLAQEKYSVTGYVRRKEHGELIKASGASDVVYGDLSNSALITEHTVAHDIVIHTATADDLPSVKAVLDGIQQRAEKGLSTIYIHTSGSAMTNDGACGAFKSTKIYRDSEPAEIDSIPADAPHREIDMAIVQAKKSLGAKAKIAIMIPPIIHGLNSSHGRLSITMPILTRYALKYGFAGHVGEGLSVHSTIHVLDLARGYVVLLHHLESSSPSDTQVLNNPYYFCDSTDDKEPSWKEIAAVIGEGLHKAGKISDPTPRTIPKDTYGDVFGELTEAVMGLNSRIRAVRLRELGWKPVEKDLKAAYMEDELPILLK
ncbi:NAD(P)-binding protein [Xylariaceae sp. FL1651]|nr:NAD(P)-binding protein [Xylariaceae sp. FL1651]